MFIQISPNWRINLKVKRIKKLKVNNYEFNIVWKNDHSGGHFSYPSKTIEIGIKNQSEELIFASICHELMEIVAIEMNVKLHRPDCRDDYIFVYDHRQHDTMSNMFSSLITQFIA